MGRKLKLYVWENVLVDYTSGIAFALAHDEDEARRMVTEQRPYSTEEFVAKPKVYDRVVAFTLHGGG